MKCIDWRAIDGYFTWSAGRQSKAYKHFMSVTVQAYCPPWPKARLQEVERTTIERVRAMEAAVGAALSEAQMRMVQREVEDLLLLKKEPYPFKRVQDKIRHQIWQLC